jgi:hypothetical protein
MNTCRVFFGTKRYSTGRTLADNSFLQVFPTQERFVSEAEWRTAWTKKIIEEMTKQITFSVDTTIARNYQEISPTPSSTIASVPPSTTTPAPPKPKSKLAKWYCSYCEGIPGKDHRMCVCKANYNSSLWEANRTFPEFQELTNKASVSDSWTFTEKFRNVELPAGTYYIGDLCYALQDTIYDKVFGKDGYQSGFYQSPNGSFLVDNTAYGDGEYPGTDKHNYCVDAGIIGIASLSACDKKNMEENGSIGGGHIYTFNDPVTCSFKGGNFNFSTKSFSFTIHTSGYDDDY